MKYLATLLAALTALTLTACDEIGSGKITVGDADGDGYLDAAYDGGDDCDDTDYDVNPDVNEDPYDGIDNDCNPNTVDDDLDGDGYDLADDCDDENADVNPRAWDTHGDGLDNNCDGTVDGFRIEEVDVAYEDGTDCDDTDYDVNPDVNEDPYDGIDNDCNPNTVDDDLDGDGYDLADDCDDENADVNPRAWDTRGDGLDNNCDGTVDGFRIEEVDVAPGVGYIDFSSDYPEKTHGVILFAFLDEATYQSGNDTCPGGGFWWALLTNMENTGDPMWDLVKADGPSCFHQNLQTANLDNLYLAICALDDISLVGEGNRCVAWGGEGTPIAMESAMNELFDPETDDLYLSDFQRNLLLIGKENTGWTWSNPTSW